MASQSSQNYLKTLVKWILPYQLVLEYQKRRGLNWDELQKEFLKSGFYKENEGRDTHDRPSFDYEAAIAFLKKLNCDEQEIRGGSIPEKSLNFAGSILENEFSHQGSIVGLHVGNFVGISLAYFLGKAISINPQSVLFSIDPNIVHRGIDNPLDSVVGLLDFFGLQDSCAILTGYSLEVNRFDEVSKKSDSFLNRGKSPGNQLNIVESIGLEKFNFVVVDGSHEGEYVGRELNTCYGLLKTNGLVFMDDVSVFWQGVKDVYDQADGSRFKKIAYDGRIGVLKKIQA